MAAYTETLCDEICTKIEETSFGLRRICRLLGQPYDTVKDWIYKDQHGFAAKYELAKQLQQDRIADEILEIADDGSKDPETQTVQRDKLRIDARKWLLTNLGTRRLAAADKPKDPPDKPKDPPLKIGFVKIPPRELPREENSGIQKIGFKSQKPPFAAPFAEKAKAANEKKTHGYSEDGKINPTKLDGYFSFMQGSKSANSKLFKDFRDEAEMEKNSQIVGFILPSSLSNMQTAKEPSPLKKLRLLKESCHAPQKRENIHTKPAEAGCNIIAGV